MRKLYHLFSRYTKHPYRKDKRIKSPPLSRIERKDIMLARQERKRQIQKNKVIRNENIWCILCQNN